MRACVAVVLLLACKESRQAPPKPPPVEPALPGLQPPEHATTRDALPAPCSGGACISACRAGDDDACRGYARAMHDERYPDAAREVAEAGCAAKSRAACELVADLSGDADVMAQYFERSCTLGGGSACWRLANWYADGRGVTQDEARAVALWRQACDGGFAPACSTLGLHFASRGQHAEAVTAYQRACDANHEGACTELALMVADGRGVDANRERALALLEPECTKYGSVTACDAHREIAARVYPLEVLRYRAFLIRHRESPFGRPNMRSKADAKKRADEAARANAGGTDFDVVATKYSDSRDHESPPEEVKYRHVRDPHGVAEMHALEGTLFALAPGGVHVGESEVGFTVYVKTGSK